MLLALGFHESPGAESEAGTTAVPSDTDGVESIDSSGFIEGDWL